MPNLPMDESASNNGADDDTRQDADADATASSTGTDSPSPGPSIPTTAKPKRTRTGCITCRIRRVKCDEVKPACVRCTQSKRQCDGYLPASSTISRRKLANAVRNLGAPGPASEALLRIAGVSPSGQHNRTPSPIRHLSPSGDDALFDFFLGATIPSTTRFLPSDFWAREVPILATGDGPARHAALALAALHRRWEDMEPYAIMNNQVLDGRVNRDRSERHPMTALAMKHYAIAVSLAHQINNPAQLLTLALTLLAVCNALGRWHECRTHILAGLRLVEQHRRRQAAAIEAASSSHAGGTAPPTNALLDAHVDDAADMLARLDMQAMTLIESRAPYPYNESASLTRLRANSGSLPGVDNYGRAGTALFEFIRHWFLLDSVFSNCEIDASQWRVIRDEIFHQLDHWEVQTAAFEARNPPTSTTLPAVSLRLWHALLRMFLYVNTAGAETRYDVLLPLFCRIVILAGGVLRLLEANSASSLSLEPGVIVPLYFTAVRCRHPVIRGEAIRLLRSRPRVEGIWNSPAAAGVAERVAEIETGLSPFPPPSPAQTAWFLDEAQLNTEMAISWDSWVDPAIAIRALTDDRQNWTWAGVDPIPDTRRMRETVVIASVEDRKVDVRLMFWDGDDVERFWSRNEVVYY